MREIAAGARETCATASGDRVYCWGEGRDGALGTPRVESSNLPIEIDGLEP